MGISRYTAIPDQRIIQTHVAQDLGLANAALASRQKAYDEGAAFDQSIQDSLSKFATRDVDVARKNQLVKDYQQQAQSIVEEQYGGDYSRAMPALKKLANAASQNEYWQRATSALARQKDFYDAQKRITEKGGIGLEFNNDAVRKAVYNEDGSFNNIDYDLQEQLNYTKPKLELMEGIAKDSRLQGIGQSAIEGVLKYGKATGVDAKKVLAVAQEMLLPYMSTNEGRQEMRYLTEKQGYTPQQAQRIMLTSLANVGSKQVGSDVDMSYMGDPSYTKPSELKEDDITVLDTESPAVDYNPVPGLSLDDWKRKDRVTGTGKLFMNPAAIAADPKGAEAYFAKNKGGKNTYAGMTPEQRGKAADLIARTFPVYAKKLRDGTISEKGMDFIAPSIRTRLRALSNLKVGTRVQGVMPDQDYGSFGKGEEGLTKALLGSDNLSNISSGKLINTVIYDPQTGEKMSGRDFNEKVLIPAQAAAREGKMNATARITGRYGAANPYSLLTNDESFADSKQLVIGGKQYVVAGLNETTIRSVRGKDANGNPVKGTQNINLSAVAKEKGEPITKAMRNVGQNTKVTLGGAEFKMRWNADGTFTFPDQVDPYTGKKGLVTDDPESVLDAYLQNQK